MWWYPNLISVVIHNTIDFGKKLLFQGFSICFRIDFQTFVVHKKRLRGTFLRYTCRNHCLFQLSIGVMEKEIILNIIFIFKSIDTTVLRVWGNIQIKFLFILQYTFFDKTAFPKSAKASPFCLSSFRTSLSSNVWTVLIHFSLSSPVLFQPLLATCGYQDYLLVNRLNFK